MKLWCKRLIQKMMLSVCVLGLCSTSSYAANVVFDLGGVIVGQDIVGAAFTMGLKNSIRYLIAKRQSPRKLLFDVLNVVDLPGSVSDTEKAACDDKGNLLPIGLIKWLNGAATGPQIIEAVNSYLTENNTDFDNIEKAVVKGMVRVSFDPALFSKRIIIFDKGIEFVQECKNQGHKVFVLSNLDRDSFVELKKLLPGFFEQFDGIVISAEVGMMKPDPSIYEYLLQTYNLDPSQTVFIDDQQENLKTAKLAGIHPLLAQQKRAKSKPWQKYPDFNDIAHQFESWIEGIEEKSSIVPTALQG